nr:Protein POLAR LOCALIZATION DURING ASYMMETRIC DIVISION AND REDISTRIBUTION like [Ipomoea batatas]
MDAWIAAVAAGAVYFAQHWKDLLKGKTNSGDSPHGSPRILKHNSLPNIHQALDKDCPSPRMMLRKGSAEDVSRARELGREDTVAEVASANGLFIGNLGILDYSHSCDASSCSNSLVGSKCDQNFQECREGAWVGGDINEDVDDLSVHPNTIQMGFSHRLASRRYRLRSRKTTRHIMNPSIFLESPVAQFSSEQIEGEYVFGSVPLQPTPRTFLVTDGSVIISRNSGDSFGTPVRTELDKLQKSVIPQGETTISRVPKLPNVEPSEFQRKDSASKKDQGRIFCNSSRSTNSKHHRSKGSSDEAFLLSLGASIGFFISFLLFKKERDELNHILKQKDNLVQDLQDELEMKDSLTVKELATEDYESEYTRIDASVSEALYSLAPQQNLNDSSEYCVEEYPSPHTEEESRSKIEAELEAELERLELSMTSTKVAGKLTELVELDPDFIPDLAEGELRDDVFDRTEPLRYADRDESTDHTPQSVNYCVSPRELSLRLYEVVNSQLEERNRELETEVENLQRKARYMEVVLNNSCREFSNSEAGSSSAQGSPVTKDERLTADCVVMNLAGEALDAYNDGYDELSKIIESEEDDIMASGVGKIQHQELVQPRDHDLYHNGTLIGDKNEDRDEVEKLLIEQIVKKVRKGNPAVFSAQKALFYLDEK